MNIFDQSNFEQGRLRNTSDAGLLLNTTSRTLKTSSPF